MKIKTIRMSGNPVDPDKADEYTKEWQNGFDSLTEEHGKFGPAISKALDAFESELSKKYSDLTIIEIDLPQTDEAWKELMGKYGNIMVSTNVETGELLFVVHDMVF